MSEAATVAEAMTCLALNGVPHAGDETRAASKAGNDAARPPTHADAAHAPPEWILLDLMLPDGSGLDVLRKVRARRLPTKTCIITGCAGEMLNEARRAGAEHTFVKPLDVEHLVEVMTATA